MQNKMMINLAQISTGFVDLPGMTTTNVFVQGCKFHCEGCQNKDLWNFTTGTSLDADLVASTVISRMKLSDWMCWLGGDPFFQADAVSYISGIIKKAGKHVAIYTGATIDEIRSNPDAKNFVNIADVLLVGRWNGIPITNRESNQEVWISHGLSRISWKDLENDLANGYFNK